MKISTYNLWMKRLPHGKKMKIKKENPRCMNNQLHPNNG
jgi:hypothetical protein